MKGHCVTQRISGICGTNLTIPLSLEYGDGCKEDVRTHDCVIRKVKNVCRALAGPVISMCLRPV